MTPKSLLRKIEGKIVDLVPLADGHTPGVVRLRNSPHVRAFFDEKDETTLASQTAFLRQYEAWPDDLYWAICLKDGTLIGTNRLNEIDEASGTKGSLALDAAYVRAGPYALEADLLLIAFAFDVLKLQILWTDVRPDNEKMISLNERLGFRWDSPRLIRGRSYGRFKLERAAFAPEAFDDLIDYFAQRLRPDNL